MSSLSRRKVLKLGAGSAALAFAGGPALPAPSDAEALIAAFTGGKPAESGKIAIDLPDVAEDGNAVPFSVAVDSPMQPDNFVSDVLVVAERNPRPGVATFHFTAISGRAEATTRIRLAETQNVIVVARTSDGRVFAARRHVQVTVGGCTS